MSETTTQKPKPDRSEAALLAGARKVLATPPRKPKKTPPGRNT